MTVASRTSDRRRPNDRLDTITTCCDPVGDAPLSSDDAARLARWFAVLGDPTRLRLLSLIANQGESCAACDLVEPLGVSQPTVSHHLKTLHEAGLVDRAKRGRWVYYSARLDRLDALARLLTAGHAR